MWRSRDHSQKLVLLLVCGSWGTKLRPWVWWHSYLYNLLVCLGIEFYCHLTPVRFLNCLRHSEVLARLQRTMVAMWGPTSNCSRCHLSKARCEVLACPPSTWEGQ